MTEHKEYIYQCFISYAHRDNHEKDRKWASWLQETIEQYNIPPRLVGNTNSKGEEIPSSLSPVFRDSTSLPASANLSRSLINALEASRYLLVICSPSAAKSEYVIQEVEHFKTSNREDRIISCIVNGSPNDLSCFPAPLIENCERPLAADFRLSNGTEGYTSAKAYKKHVKLANDIQDYEKHLETEKLKIISGLLGISLDELIDRDKEFRQSLTLKRTRELTTWISIVFVLLIAGIWLLNANSKKAKLVGEFDNENSELKGELFERESQIHEFEKVTSRAINQRKYEGEAKRKAQNEARDQEGLRWLSIANNAIEGKKDSEAALIADMILGFPESRYSQNQESYQPFLHSNRSPDNLATVRKIKEQRRALPFIWSGRNPEKEGINLHSICFLVDGYRIVEGASKKTSIIWDMRTGSISKKLSHETDGQVTIVAKSNDGTRISFGTSEGEILTYNTDTWSVSKLAAHSSSISSLTYSNDSSILASGSIRGSIKAWNAHSKNIVAFDTRGEEVSSLAISPNNDLILTTSVREKLLAIYSFKGQIVSEKPGRFNGAEFFANSSYIRASLDGIAILYTCGEDINLESIINPGAPMDNQTTSANFEFSAGSSDNLVCIVPQGILVDPGPNEPIYLTGHSDTVSSVDFCPFGNLLIRAAEKIKHPKILASRNS